jgi:hypothetical protein
MEESNKPTMVSFDGGIKQTNSADSAGTGTESTISSFDEDELENKSKLELVQTLIEERKRTEELQKMVDRSSVQVITSHDGWLKHLVERLALRGASPSAKGPKEGRRLLYEQGWTRVFLTENHFFRGKEEALKEVIVQHDNKDSFSLALSKSLREAEIHKTIPRHPNVVSLLNECRYRHIATV